MLRLEIAVSYFSKMVLLTSRNKTIASVIRKFRGKQSLFCLNEYLARMKKQELKPCNIQYIIIFISLCLVNTCQKNIRLY